jgi:hypothetical protein
MSEIDERLVEKAATGSGIGWNAIWFVPAALYVLAATEWHVCRFAWMIVKLTLKRWHWIGIIDPSADLCFAVTVLSVTLPVQAVLSAGDWLADRTKARTRLLSVIMLLFFVLALPLITDTLIWGSFPFTYDNAGYGRIRFIPFVPWPSGGYLVF